MGMKKVAGQPAIRFFSKGHMSEIFIDFFSFYGDEKKEQSLLDTLLQIASFSSFVVMSILVPSLSCTFWVKIRTSA